jgi:NAD(P)-dependent dehydrogenase (short-subunit alcohol dehydrogenase family)
MEGKLMTNDPTRAFRLDGRVAVITGASSGIGAELARAFARAGARVAVIARRADRLETLVSGLRAEGATALPVSLDVRDAAALPAAFDRITAELGVADILVNNAGIARVGSFLRASAAERDDSFAVNFDAAWDLSAEASRRMIAAARPGCIINIASVLALGAAPGYAAYATSKAALVQLTRCLALELQRHSIRVNGLAPGWFVTEMNDDWLTSPEGRDYLARTPARRAGRLEELVGPALLLASDAGSFINGVTLAVDGAHHAALA